MVSTPLKHMSSSVGMTIPNIWKRKKHVPNHQPAMDIYANLINHLKFDPMVPNTYTNHIHIIQIQIAWETN